MAWSLASGDYVEIDLTDVAIPDGSWAFSCLINPDNISPGYTYNIVFNHGGYSEVFMLRFFNGGTPQVIFSDDDGTQKAFGPYGNYWFSNGVWTQVGIARIAGTHIQLRINGQAVWDSGNDTDINGIADIGPVKFGNSSSSFLGKVAELAFWNRELTTDEWNRLGKNGYADFHAPSNFSPAWYCPAIDNFTEIVEGYTVTNNGASITTHPTVSVDQTLEIGELFSLFSAYVPSVSYYPSEIPFPSVVSTTETQFASLTTTHNVQMPATVDAGDLLLAFISIENAPTPTITTPSGWTLVSSGENGAARLSIYRKTAAGTEGGTTVNFATSGNSVMAAQVRRIINWSAVEAGSPATGASDSPDSPSLNPSGWDTEKTLWFAVLSAADDDATVSAYPSGYSGGVDTISGAGLNTGCTVASAYKENEAASENPGVFTLSESEAWTANTVAIRPITTPQHTVTAPAPENLFTAYLPAVELATALLPPSIQLFDYYSPNLVYDKILTVNETFQLFSFFSPVVNNDTISIPTTYQLFTAHIPQVVYEKLVSVGLFQLFSFYSPVVEIHFGPGTFNTETFVPQTINTDTDSFSSVVFNTSGFTRKDRNDA